MHRCGIARVNNTKKNEINLPGQMQKRIFSWALPPPSTPPPINLFAKSTCRQAGPASSMPSPVSSKNLRISVEVEDQNSADFETFWSLGVRG